MITYVRLETIHTGETKQYRLLHWVASMMHTSQGETLVSMATLFSQNDSNFSLCDKYQIMSLLSQTKLAKATIFFDNRFDNIGVLKKNWAKKTQWWE